jgi:WS/DGAT C-terminal domain
VRYRRIVDSTRRLKHSGAAAGASTMLDLTALAPPVLHAAIARSLYASRLFNVTITNVPGPQMPLYAFGVALREVHPVVPLAAEHAVGIAIFSYNGLVTFGVIADSESTPDLGVLASGIEEGSRGTACAWMTGRVVFITGAVFDVNGGQGMWAPPGGYRALSERDPNHKAFQALRRDGRARLA